MNGRRASATPAERRVAGGVEPSQAGLPAADGRAAPELPADFEVQPRFLDPAESEAIFRDLRRTVDWQQNHLSVFGRRVALPRLTAWYGDPGSCYAYSGIVNDPLPWTETLQRLRILLQDRTGAKYNSVLLNLYRDARDGVGWHSDDEPELGSSPTIASLSFGEARRLRFRHKRTRESINLELSDGSLLVMRGRSQRDWDHCVPKSTKNLRERINATFRQVLVSQELRAGP